MENTGVAVSTCDRGINEPVTVTLFNSVTASWFWAIASDGMARAAHTALTNKWRFMETSLQRHGTGRDDRGGRAASLSTKR